MDYPTLKNAEDIKKLIAANKIVCKALDLVAQMARPGISTGEINDEVEKLIFAADGVPLFKNYPSMTNGGSPYPASICTSINEEVVHGIPSKQRILQNGQILSVDVGVRFQGFCGDAARTFPIGEIGRKARKLLAIAEECLDRAIAVIKPNVKLKEISLAVQRHAEKNGYSVVRQFVGHGIGREMHEPPQVPNFVGKDDKNADLVLPIGTVLAIEPMVNIGGSDVMVRADGWTIITRDRSLSAHFERSVAITENGALILSDW